MRKIPIAETTLDISGESKRLMYAVVVDEIGVSPDDPEAEGTQIELECYGIEASLEGDSEIVRGLTLSAAQVLELAKALCQAAVTPVHMREVLEDFCV